MFMKSVTFYLVMSGFMNETLLNEACCILYHDGFLDVCSTSNTVGFEEI